MHLRPNKHKPVGNVFSFTLADARVAVFKIPTQARLEPVFDALQSIPDVGTVPVSLRNVRIVEAAGMVIGYVWADTDFALSADWRKAESLEDFGAAVVDELIEGIPPVEASEGIPAIPGYAPWTKLDIPNCLSALTVAIQEMMPSAKEIKDASNFTGPPVEKQSSP